MAHLIDHILKLQILAFFFILIFFWILESFSSSQKIAPKISHTVFNAKFLLLVVPVQFILSVGVLLVATFSQKNQWGILYFLPISFNSIYFFIISFIVLDFFDYLYHVMMHKTPLFWKFHQVHHSDKDVDISTTVREHPGETFIRVSYLILVICIVGTSPWVLVFKQFIESFSNLVSHSKIKLPPKLNYVISLLFVTPNTHHIHHHYMLPQTDTNFGDVLTIWDRIFSTFYKMKQSDIIYGVDTNMCNEDCKDFKNLLLTPFKKNECPIKVK